VLLFCKNLNIPRILASRK